MLSNEADFDRVDEVRAGCDAILVGAATVRNDDPRLLVRCPERVATAAGRPRPAAVAGQGDRHRPRRARPGGPRSSPPAAPEKLVYCASAAVARPRAPARRGRHRRRRRRPVELRRVSEDLHARGVRRLMVEGGGTIHTQFLTDGPGRRAAAGGRAVLRRRPRARRFVGDGRVPVLTRTGAPGWSRSARSATWCCCATPCRARFAGDSDGRSADRPRRRSAPGCTVPLRLRRRLRPGPRCMTFDGLADGARAPGARPRRPRRAPAARTAGAGAQRVPDRRRVRQRRCDCGPQLREAVRADRGGRRLPALPAPGGPRHRALRQARRLRAPGRRPGHLRRQPRARATPRTSATTRPPRRCCARSASTGSRC